MAQKSQPIGVSGRRETITAPIVEKLKIVTTARSGEKSGITMTFSSHWSTITL